MATEGEGGEDSQTAAAGRQVSHLSLPHPPDHTPSSREAETLDSDEEMEAEPGGGGVVIPSAPPPKAPKHDLMIVEEVRSLHLYCRCSALSPSEQGRARSSFFKQTKAFPMFPCKEEKLKWDDYGEPIRCVGGVQPVPYSVCTAAAAAGRRTMQ